MFVLGKDILYGTVRQTVEAQQIRVRTRAATYEFETSLLGAPQCQNAGMAIGLVEVLLEIRGGILPDTVARAGHAWFLAGRFQIIARSPTVILDVAHTPESVEQVGITIKKIFPGQKIKTIVGISRDKDVAGILRAILEFADEVILTRADHPRSLDWAQEKGLPKTAGITPRVADAMQQALTTAEKNDVILVVGSFFVAAEAAAKFSVIRSPSSVF